MEKFFIIFSFSFQSDNKEINTRTNYMNIVTRAKKKKKRNNKDFYYN